MAMTQSHHAASRVIITGTTVLLGVGAVGLIFAPLELATALGFRDPRSVVLVLELYGAALFGLAMTGWMVRGAVIGGIFGRSYVVGNASHAVVGAFALLRVVMAPGAGGAVIAFCAAYCVLALLFGYLMFAATPAS